MMNMPSYEYDPWFVHQTMREKQALAASERLARQAQQSHRSGMSALYPVRRRLGLQLIAFGMALQGPSLQAEHRHHESLDTMLL